MPIELGGRAYDVLMARRHTRLSASSVLFPAATMIQDVEFALDSLLEGAGFELTVPRKTPGVLAGVGSLSASAEAT